MPTSIDGTYLPKAEFRIARYFTVRQAAGVAAALTVVAGIGLHWALPQLQPPVRLSEITPHGQVCDKYLQPTPPVRNIKQLGQVDYAAFIKGEPAATREQISLKCH